MDCTDAYREALTRDFSSTASSAPERSQRQDAGTHVPAAAGAAAGGGPAMALAEDATVGIGPHHPQFG